MPSLDRLLELIRVGIKINREPWIFMSPGLPKGVRPSASSYFVSSFVATSNEESLPKGVRPSVSSSFVSSFVATSNEEAHLNHDSPISKSIKYSKIKHQIPFVIMIRLAPT
jgi:hypothetical protein